MAQDGPSSNTLLIVLAVLVVAGAGVWYWLRPENAIQKDPAPRELTSEEFEELSESQALAIGHLENKEYESADDLLVQIAERLPDNPGVWRNIAITRTLPLIDQGSELDPLRAPDKFAAAMEKAEQALNRLEELAPDSATTWLLRGKLATRIENAEAAKSAFDKATELADWDPSVWFASAISARDLNDSERETRAVGQAYQLKPRNLWLITQWIQLQAAAKDSAIVGTIRSSEDIIEPFAEQIQVTINFDVLDAMKKAVTAAEASEWSQVGLQARLLGNVMKPQIATLIDQRRIDRNLMEYIQHELKVDGFDTDEVLAEAVPEIEVSFVPTELAVAPAGEEQFEVRDVTAIDFDLDGRTDLVLLTSDSVIVLEPGDGGLQWNRKLTHPLDGDYSTLLAADLDRDYTVINDNKAVADPDVVILGKSGLQILRNQLQEGSSERSLETVTQSDEFNHQPDSRAGVLVDFDHDGDLDIVVAVGESLKLWSNLDNLTFADVSSRSAMPQSAGTVTSLTAVDWNRDVAIDILIGVSEGQPAILENIFHGRFRYRPLSDDIPDCPRSNQLALLDADANASWDLALATEEGLHLELTETPDSGVVESLRSATLDDTASSQVITLDFDNDGYMDLAAVDASGLRFLRGVPGGRFEAVQIVSDQIPEIGRIRAADYDGDGDIDLLAISNNSLRLIENQGGDANQSINITIQGDFNPEQFPSQRVNMQGIGSLIEVRTGPIYQAQVVTGQSTHFGLGPNSKPDLVRVLWTDGVPHNELDVQADKPLYAIQVLKGSCPYLYTWTGERFEFLTDCLWAAPIGLQFAEGVLASPREWEYLLIPGDRLKPRNGRYVIQLTEELWEAAYFDEVKLIAIDHPADTQIFSNEKVGPASIAEFKIHTVSNAKIPKSVEASNGVDVAPGLAARDRNFVKAFDQRIKQGLTPMHHIDLDLGEIQNGDRVTLFLTGWVMPTDTSLNIAIGQNPDIDSPRPPFLSIPAADGTWKEAIPYVGFPGGKTKTIAIDVSEHLKTDDPRIRISTSMELYWDHIFFTVNEPESELHRTDLAPVAADLHFRGFSKRRAGEKLGPENYVYDETTTQSPWSPMSGRFTRYGDVAPLLTTTDRRMVILSSGDEMTVEFEAPDSDLPDGWTRDFFLYNVGWDKDADLNTVFGQTVEPMPAAKTPTYPLPPESESISRSDDYEEYLREYQTRELNRRRFWRELLPEPNYH